MLGWGIMNQGYGAPRRWLALAIPLFAVGLVTAFFLLVRSGGDARLATLPLQPAASATQTPLRTADAPAEYTTPLPSPVADADAPAAPVSPEEDIVALVGGVALSRQDLEATLVINRVMAELTGQPPTTTAAVLEQSINTELVLQRSGAALDLEAARATLDAILARHGQNRTTLERELAAMKVAGATLDVYIARIVAADDYLRSQSAATGVSAAALIKAWQRETQISFGPVANAILGASVAQAPLPDAEDVATQPPTAAATAALTSVEASVATLDPDAPRGVEIGQIAPDFTLLTVDGADRQYSLRSLLGRPAVLIFWTTWCPYCLRQTPVLVAAHREWGEEIQFVGVNVAEDASIVTPYIAEHEIGYPVLLDRDGAAAGAYAVQGYPTTYFLDNSAHIVARHVGALTEEQLNSYLQTLRPDE